MTPSHDDELLLVIYQRATYLGLTTDAVDHLFAFPLRWVVGPVKASLLCNEPTWVTS